jgi:hypothetical protein
MSHWMHKLGAFLATAGTLLPALNLIPGAGPAVKIASTAIGLIIAFKTDLEKVWGGGPPAPSS